MTNDAPNPPNPYQILGIEPTFSVSPEQIQHAYLQKLTTTHPDLVSQDPPNTSNQSLDPATLNNARDTLLNDESRANLMLALIGGPSPKDKSLPENYLMHMMELRTQIEEELTPQSKDPDKARAHWQSWATDQRNQTITTITDLFNQITTADPTTATNLKQKIRTHLNAHRYTQRLIEQLDPTYHPSTADF